MFLSVPLGPQFSVFLQPLPLWRHLHFQWWAIQVSPILTVKSPSWSYILHLQLPPHFPSLIIHVSHTTNLFSPSPFSLQCEFILEYFPWGITGLLNTKPNGYFWVLISVKLSVAFDAVGYFLLLKIFLMWFLWCHVLLVCPIFLSFLLSTFQIILVRIFQRFILDDLFS